MQIDERMMKSYCFVAKIKITLSMRQIENFSFSVCGHLAIWTHAHENITIFPWAIFHHIMQAKVMKRMATV